MKTNLISKAVVMIAVVMASVMNFSASASTGLSSCEPTFLVVMLKK